ncbi:MAG: hypothetical protein ISS01_00155 [Nanoarchaeota archaeon]|nr:hypothetical protein [Nanoarchaeota archaeon]
MIIRALLPKLTPKTVKEKIIVILSTEFPLTVKELKSKIKQLFNQSVSYQSVHKELNQLIKEKVVVAKNKKFLLNLEWIRQVGLFSDLIVSNYTSQKKHSINKLLELKNDGDSLSFEFESYAQLDVYFLELLDYFNEFFEEEKKILMHYTHNWWPLVYPMKEKQVIKKLKSGFFCICGAESEIDKFCCNYEQKIGINVLQSKDKGLHWNVNVMGDLIFSFYGDDEINKEIHDFFKKYKDLKSLDLDQLTGLLEKKGLFRVVVLKDSIYAKKVLEETKLFNIKKT